MTCPGFTELLYDLMGWDKQYRYKILGYRIEFNGDTYYVFDLTVPQRFREKPKKGEIEEILESGRESEKIDTRKGSYPEKIAGSFGVSVEEDRRTLQFAIQCCEISNQGAHRLPDDIPREHFDVKSKELVRFVYRECGWDSKITYRVPGTAHPEQRMVSFNLRDALDLHEGRLRERENR